MQQVVQSIVRHGGTQQSKYEESMENKPWLNYSPVLNMIDELMIRRLSHPSFKVGSHEYLD